MLLCGPDLKCEVLLGFWPGHCKGGHGGVRANAGRRPCHFDLCVGVPESLYEAGSWRGWLALLLLINLSFLHLGQQDRDFVEYFAGKAEFSANMWKVLALGFLLLC